MDSIYPICGIMAAVQFVEAAQLIIGLHVGGYGLIKSGSH